MSEREGPSANGNSENFEEKSGEGGARPEEARVKAGGGEIEPEPADSQTLDVLSEKDQEKRESIGAYRLVKKLGEGGMGQVWLAEQTAPVKRQVAVKLIKGGWYDSSVIQRFEAERQSLAIMDHPAIAKVFDAGSTPDGQPYFVMEYVAGKPITRYCDEKKLKVRERLELFIKVCEGVQHAHQKAIIHRDLKPSNILVAETDGRAVPRIIDFGIAKAISAQADLEQTMFTQAGMMVGTLGFMSPEQADPNVRDVDTRTDVYSLGVVLYALLTGMLPFDSEDRKKRPLDEVLRQLREEDAPSPSIKLTTGKEPATAAAERRGATPKQLVRILKGDLDWITTKAVERERARRYGTPTELAADVRRYLEKRPVVARPASTPYRLKRYVQRHRVGVAVAAGAMGLLMAFGVVQALQLRQTTRERDRANRITDFMTSMFVVSDPSEAKGNKVTAREILDKASGEIDAGLAKDPELQAQMMYVMGSVYENLGLYSRARPLVERAVEIQKRVLGPKHPKTLRSMHLVAFDLQQEGRYAEAKKLEAETLEQLREVVGPTHPDTLAAMTSMGLLLEYEGHHAEAEKMFREALEGQRKKLGSEHPVTLAGMRNLAWGLRDQGKAAEAERVDRDALEIERRVYGLERQETLATMDSLGTILEDQGKYEEAEKLFREALEAERRVLGPEHPLTLGTMTNLGSLLQKDGRLAEAEKLDRETLEIKRRVLGPQHPETLLTTNNLASILLSEAHYEEAEKEFAEILNIHRQVLGPEHPYTIATMINLAEATIRQGRYAQAEKLNRETLEIEQRVLGEEHPYTRMTKNNLRSALMRQGNYSEAGKLARENVAVELRLTGPDSRDVARATYSLACVLALEGKKDEALSTLGEAIDRGLDPDTALAIAKDTDLKSLFDDPGFNVLVARAKERAAAMQKPN